METTGSLKGGRLVPHYIAHLIKGHLLRDFTAAKVVMIKGHLRDLTGGKVARLKSC